MATAHLLFGFLGAGKTALATRLEVAHRAVRFTPDEWMAGMFGADPPAATFQERATALAAVMQPIWMRCLSLGIDVVLDYGLWRRAERDAMRSLVHQAGGVSRLYRLDCPDDVAWERIMRRNASPGRTLHIARETFDALKARWEPLGTDEDYVTVV